MGTRITTIDTNGTKSRPLARGELGYDDFADIGRVYVGTTAGTDIALAKLSEIASLIRVDKYLAAQNIAKMIYSNGDLVKIRYTTDTDTDYEVFHYTSGNLTSIDHYLNSVLKGTTTLSYTDGSLASVVFVGV